MPPERTKRRVLLWQPYSRKTKSLPIHQLSASEVAADAMDIVDIGQTLPMHDTVPMENMDIDPPAASEYERPLFINPVCAFWGRAAVR